MKRIEFLRKMSIEDFVERRMKEDEYDITELACKRMMQNTLNEELPCHGRDADDCFPGICKDCILKYLNEEVDENGEPVTGKTALNE